MWDAQVCDEYSRWNKVFCSSHRCVCVCVWVLTGCERWSRQEGVLSLDGSWYPLTSLTDCQTRCLQISTCVAVYVSLSVCVVHMNPNDTATKLSVSDFTQYTLNRACQSPTPTSASSTSSIRSQLFPLLRYLRNLPQIRQILLQLLPQTMLFKVTGIGVIW